MKIIKDKILIFELRKMAEQMFGNLVKVVVDVEKKIMVVDGELHSDEEALLLEKGSQQKNLWGINIYPEVQGSDWIEFDSMINLRPSFQNISRGVDDLNVRKRIRKIVDELVER